MRKFTLIILLLSSIFTQSYSQTCLPEGITFETQAQVDSFAINYPNCKKILGDLNFKLETDINNTDALNNLTAVMGNLHLNGDDKSLKGLSNIDTVGGYLFLITNVTSCEVIKSIEFIGKSLSLGHSDSLKSLKGLEKLKYVGTYISISDCKLLQVIEGFDSLRHLGALSITGNERLKKIEGFNFVNDIGTIEIKRCDSLKEINILNNVERITYWFEISDNDQLEKIEGFSSLKTIDGIFIINSQMNLNDLSVFKNLTSINRGFYLYGSKLENLNDFSSLSYIKGRLDIRSNHVLSDISALENIKSDSIRLLCITNNENLSNCAIKSVCDYIGMQPDKVTIAFNNSGCESAYEVLDICSNSIDEEMYELVNVYPNPAKDKINIKTKNGEEVDRITVYNAFGKIILSELNCNTSVDLSQYETGIYIVEVKLKNQMIRKKVMVY